MAVSLTTGQEMKLTVQSVDPTVNSRSKTIRYVNPLATNTTDLNCTALARDLFASSQNTYKATKGSIELGYLDEE